MRSLALFSSLSRQVCNVVQVMGCDQQVQQQQQLDSLLQRFATELEEWHDEVAAGLAAVATLQRSLSELQPSEPSKEALAVYNRLLELAPSFRLEEYIKQQQQPKLTVSAAASQIHAAVNKVQAAVASAQDLLSNLQDTSEQYQDTVLSQSLQGTHLNVPALGTEPGSGELCQDAAAPAAAASAPPPTAAAAASAHSGAVEADVNVGQQAESAAKLQPEEVALLMEAVTSGLQQDLQWMEAAAAGISLDTRTEDLGTLRALWELQPFTNEAAVAQLMAAAQDLKAQ